MPSCLPTSGGQSSSSWETEIALRNNKLLEPPDCGLEKRESYAIIRRDAPSRKMSPQSQSSSPNNPDKLFQQPRTGYNLDLRCGIMQSSKVRKFKHTFAPPSSAPPVSAEIQSSLLQVGMRVRKSIGQGYRTLLAIEEAKLKTERAGLASRQSSIGVFPENGVSVVVDNEMIADDEAFPSSQDSLESISSNSSVSSTVKPFLKPKRKRTEGRDNNESEELLLEAQMETTSTCLRPIAQARSRKLPKQQENPLKSFSKQNPDDPGDFEEADFLVPANQDQSMSHLTDDVDY